MSCYFCGNVATGVEHVPPKCFFPRGKRDNLITVPSCDAHNQEKSKEDEYIRAILLASIKLDGHEHIKILRDTNERAIERSLERAFEKELTEEQKKEILEIITKYEEDPLSGPKVIDEVASKGVVSMGLVGLLNKGTQEETVLDDSGTEVKTTSFIYDKDRFNNFFECVARGIFFHELGKRWLGKVNLLPHTFLVDDAPQRDKDLSCYYLDNFDNSKSKGAQKDYFFYEGANEINPESGKRKNIFFNFCIFNKFYFTAIFPFER